MHPVSLKGHIITCILSQSFFSQIQSVGTRKSHAPSSTVGGDGKDVIALRDELVELKKSLNSVTRERDLIQARYSKLEQTLGRKDKEIEDLLASGHITVSAWLPVGVVSKIELRRNAGIVNYIQLTQFLLCLLKIMYVYTRVFLFM